ncbi:hypothetical protein J4573_20405 [Actinomadura barringtoniae]|uniref:Carrier domain-containing protein n=1 Tax=Actinomadura barringtoniae TaxID=1427535 RepID=A0A939PBC2_9ACTN|nr:phosphopantetheine-binding protein [Actinomadura barringtoniae]MBO2449475.1 hypothetical protein [Actinomadura barringtoniae]
MIDVTAATEATLRRIITDVLGVDEVGPDDGFFEAGGDSVLAVQVVARVREAGIDLNVRELFDHQTPAALAAAIGDRPAVPAEDGAQAGTADAEDSPLVAFTDDEFGEFEAEVAEEAEETAGAETEWETST